jgi:thioredoxin 1
MKKANFQKLISGEKPTLVDFHAIWCGPCKVQAPILKDLSNEVNGQVRIIKIDVDKNPGVANKYQVRGVPTLILFKSGIPVWRVSGVQSVQKLKGVIEEFA